MGWFDISLILLKEKQDPRSFLLEIDRKLKAISVLLEVDDSDIIVFNDTRDEKENDVFDLNQTMSAKDIYGKVCDWPGLGLLSYRHPDFSFPITINYHSWDDHLLDGFTIGFNGHEVINKSVQKAALIIAIGNLFESKFIVGDIGNASGNYIDLDQTLKEVLSYIEQHKFEIDQRG